MISKNKETHLYLKFDNNQKDAFDFDLLSFNFISDVILDLSSLETINKTLVSFLKQINHNIVSVGFCLVVVLKESPFITNIESLNIVPTLIEAEDYLQMGRIQRDLGTSL